MYGLSVIIVDAVLTSTFSTVTRSYYEIVHYTGSISIEALKFIHVSCSSYIIRVFYFMYIPLIRLSDMVFPCLHISRMASSPVVYKVIENV
jgi:hypothetical protein